MLIGAITMLARVSGFGRQVVFVRGFLPSAAVSLLASAAVLTAFLTAFLTVVALTDAGDLRAMLRRAERA